MVHEDRFVLIIEIDIQICDPSLLQNVKSKRSEFLSFWGEIQFGWGGWHSRFFRSEKFSMRSSYSGGCKGGCSDLKFKILHEKCQFCWGYTRAQDLTSPNSSRDFWHFSPPTGTDTKAYGSLRVWRLIVETFIFSYNEREQWNVYLQRTPNCKLIFDHIFPLT